MTKDEALDHCILRCEVGSTAHGVSTGADDHDEMGIMIEPIEYVAGLRNFEQFIWRSAAEREGRQDAPSQPGDTDLVIYSLRKWISLALKGNPTILSLLFAPVIKVDSRGTKLRELAPLIISKQAGSHYLGYMQSQRMKMLGEKTNRVKRPELVERFGFDTKFAYHMLRLGYQGVELLSTGRFSMPIEESVRGFLLLVRKGAVTLEECLTVASALEVKVKELMDSGPLREKPDVEAVEAWMVERYYTAWSANYGHALTLKFVATRARNLAEQGKEETFIYPPIDPIIIGSIA